jgi:hypothetical protein
MKEHPFPLPMSHAGQKITSIKGATIPVVLAISLRSSLLVIAYIEIAVSEYF